MNQPKKSATDLAQDLALRAASKPLQVSRKFINDFACVAAHYRCDQDEIVIMKDLVREHPEDAKVSYTIMAEECRELER